MIDMVPKAVMLTLVQYVYPLVYFSAGQRTLLTWKSSKVHQG